MFKVPIYLTPSVPRVFLFVIQEASAFPSMTPSTSDLTDTANVPSSTPPIEEHVSNLPTKIMPTTSSPTETPMEDSDSLQGPDGVTSSSFHIDVSANVLAFMASGILAVAFY